MKTHDINLLIADDHKMVRNGLRLMLSLQQNQGFNFLITEATNGDEAITKALKKDFDIILLDYNMPRFKGSDVVARIMMHKPYSKVIMLSNYDEKSFIKTCITNGARGYILKDIDTTELISAIETVLDGGTYFSPQARVKLYDEETVKTDVDILSARLGLSKREIEILRLITSELTNEEIGKKLEISKRTVDTHRQNLLYKLKVKNTVGLIKFAVANNITTS
jgi:DNA-binding NarL/FixJ family response regulator